MATIRKRGERWHVQVRMAGAPARTKSFLMRSDAAIWARQQEVEVERGEVVQASRQTRTLRDVLQRYLEVETPKKRGSHIEACVIGSLLRERWIEMDLKKLSVASIAEYRDRRLQAVKPATVKRQLNILYRALGVARAEWEWTVPSRLMARVAVDVPQPRPVRRLSAADERRLFKAAERCRNRLVPVAMRLALLTGLRRGELLNACWADMDLPRRIWTVPETKSGHPRRIPVTDAIVTVLTGLKGEREPTALILPISANLLRLSFERVRGRAGLAHLRFHDLRHEAISRLFEAGLSVPEVQLLSGHRTLSQLMRYAHADWARLARRLRRRRKAGPRQPYEDAPLISRC